MNLLPWLDTSQEELKYVLKQKQKQNKQKEMLFNTLKEQGTK